MTALTRKTIHPWTRLNLLLGLSLAVLLVLDNWPVGDSRKRPLTGIDPTAVREVRVERGDRLRLALRRDGADWRFDHPHTGAAVSSRVEQLLAIARAPVLYAFAPEADLQRYGLASPAAILHLDGQSLAFGDREPSQQGRYVLTDGEIRVVDDLFFHLLSLPPGHFSGD